jgi:DNA-binding GntR family transcriptional regulator
MQDDIQIDDEKSAQEKVADSVRSRIISGEFAMGAALSETNLASELGVSRTPVREALKQLQTEGLVSIRPRVGTFVNTPSRGEIIELFQMREILEGASARILAERGPVPELELLRENIAKSDAALARNDVATYVDLVSEFHQLIVMGSGNGKLVAHHTMLMNQLAFPRLVKTSLSVPGRFAKSESEHHHLLDIIETKDGATAEQFMRHHVRASQEALLAAMPFSAKTDGKTGH